MNKFLAVSIIAVLFLSPPAALAQRCGVEQTKVGKYVANYTYDAVNEFEVAELRSARKSVITLPSATAR